MTVISAQVTKNTKDNGATVTLTVADGAIDVTVERPMTITGVKGYNGSFTEITAFTTTVALKDNKKPYYINSVFDKTTKNTIHLNFNEQIQGTMTVRVTQYTQTGNVPIEFSNSVTVNGTSVDITLTSPPMNNTNLWINILDNKITDISGNPAVPMQTQIGVVALY